MMKLKRIITNLIFVASLCCLMGCNKSRNGLSMVKIPETKSRNGLSMVKIPGTNFEMLQTEVTQELYESIMGENPSEFIGKNYPVATVSWCDAIYFCNKLSVAKGYEPVYYVNANTNIKAWNYIPHQGRRISGRIIQNTSANGYRLPTAEEWQYAANGGEDYTYAGSNEIDEVAWYRENSNGSTHPIAQKKANGYGLYDMSGNVWEWCWDRSGDLVSFAHFCGGSFGSNDDECKVNSKSRAYPWDRGCALGFRIVRSVK